MLSRLAMPSTAFYAVRHGRKSGIFTSWSGPGGAEEQVKGYKMPGVDSAQKYKKFSTLSEAYSWLKAPSVQSAPAVVNSKNSKVSKHPKHWNFLKNRNPGVTSKNKLSQFSTVASSEGSVEHSEAEDRVVVYTDGCCKKGCNKSRTAGIGVNFPGHPDLNLSEPLSAPPYTNQRAELEAAIEAVRIAHDQCFPKLKLYSDSLYVINGITDWVKHWKSNGWKTFNKDDVLNKDLWVKLDDLQQQVDVEYVHVYGHTGVLGNEVADELANKGADKLISTQS